MLPPPPPQPWLTRANDLQPPGPEALRGELLGEQGSQKAVLSLSYSSRDGDAIQPYGMGPQAQGLTCRDPGKATQEVPSLYHSLYLPRSFRGSCCRFLSPLPLHFLGGALGCPGPSLLLNHFRELGDSYRHPAPLLPPREPLVSPSAHPVVTGVPEGSFPALCHTALHPMASGTIHYFMLKTLNSPNPLPNHSLDISTRMPWTHQMHQETKKLQATISPLKPAPLWPLTEPSQPPGPGTS